MSADADARAIPCEVCDARAGEPCEGLDGASHRARIGRWQLAHGPHADDNERARVRSMLDGIRAAHGWPSQDRDNRPEGG